ncbi:MAG: 7-cyano-7-deazaguanine synthase QueC [Candidatus Aminicenantes bacterium]|nr:7-cyano-7-deazaguanine synthase QueC [Candidatus Aminicenantes bacterium]
MVKSVVLFSGGVDSTTALYWALAKRRAVQALTFDYGQRHRFEVRMARKLARKIGVPQTIFKLDLKQVGGSALTDTSIELPRYKNLARIKPGPPATYQPFRNGVFMALTAAWAEARGFTEIVCGFNIIDSPDYPDTRPAFVKAMEKAINAGTRAAFGRPPMKILAPLIGMKKSAIIRLGASLHADYSYSISCYAGEEIPCRSCSACLLRERAFAEAGFEDPLISRLKKEGRL